MKKSRLFIVLFFLLGFIFPVGEAGAVFLLIAPGAAAQGRAAGAGRDCQVHGAGLCHLHAG